MIFVNVSSMSEDNTSFEGHGLPLTHLLAGLHNLPVTSKMVAG